MHRKLRNRYTFRCVACVPVAPAVEQATQLPQLPSKQLITSSESAGVQKMRRLIPISVLGAVALAQVAIAASSPAQTSASDPKPAATTSGLPPMPPLPGSESTILGGAIRNVDPVLDVLTLHIFGGHTMKIQFDERTQLFRNGEKIPLRSLGPADHASVQTALDNGQVFAESIHILSQAPQGQCQGVVRNYDPGSGIVSIDTDLSPTPIKLAVPRDTPIVRTGQPEFTAAHSGVSDLVKGTLVAVVFAPDRSGRSVARHITVLAVPGSRFIFGGTISYLNMASGLLVVQNARDGKSYQIYFSRYRFPSVTNLHVGQEVTVTASFQGTRYEATSITVH